MSTAETKADAAEKAPQIVPAIGLSSLLMVLASAAMVFLCTLALAFTFAASRASSDWTQQIARSLTIRIDGPPDRVDGLTEQALTVLRTTPGIGSAEVISQEETAGLLQEWIPNPDLLASFDLPRMIAATPSGDALDSEALALRLEGEVPGATLDDHAAWLAPLKAAADRASSLGFAIGATALFGLVAITLIAAQASMTSHRRIIETLRLLGAKDAFIARAFVTGMTIRALIGAAIGVVAGFVVLAIAPSGDGSGTGLFTTLGFEGAEWLAPVALVPLAGLLAFFATLVAARIILRRID